MYFIFYCEGITSEYEKLEETISQQDLIKKIKEKNEDDSVDGVLVQLPVPAHIRYTSHIATSSVRCMCFVCMCVCEFNMYICK